jgi:DNA-directed RNA polymerase subunit RPC12/RpoP
MSKLTERVSYLQGLADGMKLDTEKDANKLLVEMLKVFSDIAGELETVIEGHNELSDYVEAIDEDLAAVEELVLGDEDEEDDEDWYDYDEDAEDDETDVTIEYECPHCGKLLTIQASEVDFDEDMPCPYCGHPIFPETEELDQLDGETD